MLKNIIKILAIIVLVLIIALAAVFAFNPFDLRTKLIGGIINSYLSSTIEGYEPLEKDQADTTTAEGGKHPLLNEEQEKTLESYGVDVEQLPSSISPEMEACFNEKLGEERTDEIVAGDSPTAMEIFKAKKCLGE